MPTHDLVIPEGFGQATIQFSLTGDPEPMGFGLGFEALPDHSIVSGQIALDALADDWADTFCSSGASFYQGWTHLGAIATFHSSDGGVVHLESPEVIVGTAVGETPPQNCTYLVKKLTHLGGKKGRGRNYIPPFNLLESNVNKAGVLDGTVVSDQNTGWASFLALANASAAYHLFLLHRDNPVVGPVPSPTAITQFVVETMIATQRRRLR